MAKLSDGLTPSQALYVIDRLIIEKRISPAIVAKIRDEMASEIRELEERLARLRGSEEPRPSSVQRRKSPRPTDGSLSPATLASRRLQGQYLNLIRRIPAPQRSRYKQIALTKGREEAVRALRRTLKAD
jgi:hypothetical protein